MYSRLMSRSAIAVITYRTRRGTARARAARLALRGVPCRRRRRARNGRRRQPLALVLP
jgi:hypothetical protein